MTELAHSVVTVLAMGVVQTLGLASAVAARLSIGSSTQTACQGIFFVCLGLVGLSIIVSLGVAPAFWMTSGITFSLMVLTATCEFGRSRRAAAW